MLITIHSSSLNTYGEHTMIGFLCDNEKSGMEIFSVPYELLYYKSFENF